MTEVTPDRVIQDLEPMTWRGVEAPPYDTAGFTFRHTQPGRMYPNINGASHDWQGMEAIPLRFRLYFLNTIALRGRRRNRGSTTDLFPGLWNDWWKILQDGRPGKMTHPLLGERDVVVKEGTVELTAQVTSGVIVDVEFETTILDPENQAQDFTVRVALKELATDVDTKAQNADIPMPSGVVETSIFEIVAQLDGFLFALENQALGIINKAKGVIEDMVDFIDSRDSRQTVQQARDALIELWNALTDLAESVGKKLRPTGTTTLTRDMGLDVFAREFGMTIEEAIELNPRALLSPTVSQGTVMRYYR